jgi:HlyD family secretion protein
LLDPPTTVSPEMLVTATFLAPQNKTSESPASESEKLFVPRQLVQSSEAGTYVWIVDEKSCARKRMMETEGKIAGELVAVQSGLRVTDKLITTNLKGLREGTRVHVTGDDLTIGMK